MGVGALSVTSMVVEWYLRVENAKIKPKNSIKAKQKSSMPNSLKKAKKVPKCQTKIFKAKQRPTLTYLALRKAKWQPWSIAVAALWYRYVGSLLIIYISNSYY